MSEEPGVEELRGRIAQTRYDLGETVEALAAKADVKARAKGAAHDAMDGAKAKAQNAVGGVKGAVGSANSKAQGALDTAKSRSQDAVATARVKAADARGRARELTGQSGKHAASGGPLGIEGDTALVSTRRTDRQGLTEGVLLVTSIGALVGALVVWLTRPRS